MRYLNILIYSLLISGLAANVSAQAPGTIVTIAGGGLEDGDNVSATDATLDRPLGIALDTQGNLYIADTAHHRIRRVDVTTNIITTMAGTGEQGFGGDGGPATQALLNRPNAITVDSAGNIYISSGGATGSELRNRRVRRIDPSGIITTVAGTGAGGFNDGVPALEATFHEIVALTMLGDAALLIADGLDQNAQGNNRVRQLNFATGLITTIAGNGSAQASSVQDGGPAISAGLTPEQLAVPSQGGVSVFIADFNNGRIRHVAVTNENEIVINTVAGREATFAENITGDLYKGDGGSATQALFFAPSGVAIDASGNIYIGDTGNHRLRVVEVETGNVLTIAGTGIPDAGSEGVLGLLSDLNQPTRLLIDANGDLIFIDTTNDRIRKLIDPTFRMPLFNAISTNIDFDRVSFGDPASRSVLVENRGNLPVNIETFVSDNPAFRVITELPFEIGVSQIAEIEIVFDPLREGLVEGLITITTDDPRTPSATFNVQGQGEAPNIGLFPADVLTFDRTFIGQSQTLDIRISNLGAGILVVPRATVTDSQFIVELNDTLRINSSQNQPLRITFRPTAENLQQATLTIFSNDPADPIVTLQLQGIGQSAKPGGFIDIATSVGLGDTGAGFGVSWADYDNDSDVDLYLVRSTEPNKLYRNNSGTFTDIATALGVNDSGDGSAGIWGDVDRDGDLDLYVTNFGDANRLYRNDGQTFTDIATALGVNDPGDGYGAAWSDYDRDGDLDLYIANFGANHFYENDGNRFIDRTDSLGLADTESGIQPAWGDFDNDGDPDLFLANSGPNRLFRNDGQTFTSLDNLFSPTDAGPSFGAAWGDFDNDGFLDLFVPYFGTNNRFYTNEGNGQFRDQALNLGLVNGGRGRGAVWGDFDNDGFLDLYTTNSGQPNAYYKNINQSGFRTFIELADSLGVAHNADSRGIALSDFDNDGGLDLYVAVQNGPDAFYLNQEANGNWLAIHPLGTESSIDAIGLRIEVSYGNTRIIREISGGASFLSQDALSAVFGIGEAEQVDVLTLRWPSGIVQQFDPLLDDLPINRVKNITEQPPLPPARVLATADANNLLANGTSETSLTAQIVTAENRLVPISDRIINFRIDSGDGIIIAGDAIPVRDGIATARFRAGQIPGQVVILAESDGLESGRIEIELVKPFGEDALAMRTVAGFGAEVPFGGGFQGDGGLATEALLQQPRAVFADSSGNIYITDTNNHRIRLVEAATGIIQTIVGTGTAGLGNFSSGSLARQANINRPLGLALTTEGNLLISESSSHVIRQVRNDTLQSLVGAGIAQFGGDNGPASDANLANPAGIALDGEGNLYIADEFNQRIRKVDINGIITTIAGTGSPDQGGFQGDGGQATDARLNGPSAVAVDVQNNLYIADAENHRIRKVDTNGIITTIAGTGIDGFSGDGGPATLAQLNIPRGIVADNRGNLFIADTENDRIRLLNLASGLIQTVAGTGFGQLDLEEGGALAVSLNNPQGLAVGPTGTILIADRSNHRIRELTVQFDLATLFAPQEKSIDFNGDGRLDFNDFLLFVNAFDTADPNYDLDADGRVGFGDFLRFVNAFEKGQITVRP